MTGPLRPLRPCGSCPYRRDVPSGVWDASEYRKLPGFDGPTMMQTPRVFMCHQANGHLCGGWAGCHDMSQNLGLRFMALHMTDEELDATLDFTTDVPLFASGREAADHGLAEVESPSEEADRVMAKLLRKREAQDVA